MAQTISPEILQAALAGLRLQEQKIQEQIAEVEGMLGGGSLVSTGASDTPTGKRRKFSASSRRKMAAAQKARWAKLKGEAPTPEATESEPAKAKRRKLSASARKAIGEATRARWAAKRAAEQAPAKRASKKSMGRAKKASATTGKRVKRAVKKSAAPPVAEAAV